MALVIKDRVKETTTTTGTGTFNLAGAVSGFKSFDSVMTNNGVDTTYYCCTDNTNFEIGIGTFNDNGGSADTLTRDTVLASSTGSKIDWSSGTRTIFMTYPADKAVVEDASNNINGTFVGNITGNVTGSVSGSSGSTTGNAATATALASAVNINGVSFNGSGDITVTAAAGTLTGNTLNSTVTASSLTSLGTLASDLNVGGQDIINTGVSSADTHAGEYGSSSSPITFTVTVASKSGHPYQGDGSGLAYVINGVQAPALTLHGVDNVTSDSGYYYRFDQSDSSNSGHPLRFYLDADKTTEYTTGVTNSTQLGSPISPGSSGAYTQINVDEDTPNILYYQCSQHGYMGNYAIVLGSNKINHSEALISFPTATTTLVGTGTTDTLTNKTIDVDNNTVSNIEVDNFKASAIVLESEGIGSNDNDTSLPTSAAVKDYVDTQITAEDLDLTTDSGAIAIDLDSETLTVTGGTGIDTSASGNEVTISGSNASTSSKGIASFSSSDFSVSSGAVSIKSSGVSNTQLAGSIANSKLANDSVSFGGVSVDLGASDATPAFDLSDATNYPTSSLSGTITNAQLAGSIAASKLAGSIGDSKLSTISTAGKVALSALEIDGGTDVGADLVDADLIIVDDGAGGNNEKSELTRVKKYIYSAMSGDATASDAGAVTIANGAVETAMLANDAVDADKLASNAVVNASVASGAAIAFSKMENLTASRALVSDGSGDVSVSAVTSTEIGHLDGVTSAIQTQLDAKTTATAASNEATALAIALG